MPVAVSAETRELTSAASDSVDYRNVSKRYADGTVAVDGLNLQCPAGLITVFVGPSGCGKTTSLRMANKMITATSGSITVDGVEVSRMDETQLRRSMGYVIQNAGLFPHRTIQDNIATVPVLLGESRRAARAKAHELMERVGLDPSLAKRYPYQLSGGQQQRVGVARALAGDPPILLMDEPFSAVDPLVRSDLQRELLRLQAELKKTILFVTHDIDEAVTLGDQIAVFQRAGILAQVGTPERLLMSPANKFVESFIGRESGVKWLSLLPAASIELTNTPTAGEAKPVLASVGDWRLVIDENHRPVRWQHEDHDPVPCRRTFYPRHDSLRTALDSLLLSPADAAVAVDDEGRVIGLADYEAVATAIRLRRSGL